MVTGWKGRAIIGGLLSRALVQFDLNGDAAEEAERFQEERRIFEVEQGLCTCSKTVPVAVC